MDTMATSNANKLDFLPSTADKQLVDFSLRSLGAAFSVESKEFGSNVKAAKLSGRCAFVVHEGFDPIDGVSTGRVIEGGGDAGITLRHGSTAFSLTAGNLSYRSGLDDPISSAQASVSESAVPSLKATVAKEYKPDCFAAVSWDIKQRKPEFSLAWHGSTFTEKAALVVHADPLYRTYKVAASVAFPGGWGAWHAWVGGGGCVRAQPEALQRRADIGRVLRVCAWGVGFSVRKVGAPVPAAPGVTAGLTAGSHSKTVRWTGHPVSGSAAARIPVSGTQPACGA